MQIPTRVKWSHRIRPHRARAGAIIAVGAALALSMSAAHAQTGTFDHAGFDRLLHEHVVNGMVDYDAFRNAPQFATYLQSLARSDPSLLGHDDQLAFWINAYNAYTIQLITAHGERRSIRNIDKTLGFIKAYGPWREKLATIGGTAYSLDEIEQGSSVRATGRREFTSR